MKSTRLARKNRTGSG